MVERLIREGTAVARCDGTLHSLFPVAASAAEGEALREWVLRERATKTIETGFGYGISTLHMVCELLDLHTTASMYPAISTADLIQIPISLPDADTREQVVSKVHQSFDARREARRLLHEAKTMVEQAILGT